MRERLSTTCRDRVPVATCASTPHRRRGNVAILVGIGLTVISGFAALGIDIAWLVTSKSELQVATDNCAMASAAYIMNQPYGSAEQTSIHAVAFGHDFMKNNAVANMQLNADLVETGQISRSAGRVVNFVPNQNNYNAVRVKVSMTGSQRLPAILGSLLGHDYYEPSATAIALIDDHFVSYRPPNWDVGPLWPFAISKEYYDAQLAAGQDGFGYNSAAQTPVGGGDGKPEVWIYPEDNNTNGNGNGGGDDGDGGGNFGTLNIGIDNQGNDDLDLQILYGVKREHLLAEIGTDNLTFADSQGNPTPYAMTGNPGLSGGIAEFVEMRVGDVVGFFIHDGVEMNGQNAVFNIVSIRFGRVMEVDLTGQPQLKRLVIQPLPYTDPGVTCAANAPSSESMVWEYKLGA